jgi:hypothetical protein
VSVDRFNQVKGAVAPCSPVSVLGCALRSACGLRVSDPLSLDGLATVKTIDFY